MGGETFKFMSQDLKLDLANNIILSSGNIGNADEGVRERFVELAQRLQGMVNVCAATLNCQWFCFSLFRCSPALTQLNLMINSGFLSSYICINALKLLCQYFYFWPCFCCG